MTAVALETTLLGLRQQLGELRDALRDLRVTLGDRPPRDGVVLVDLYEDRTDELLGWAEEAHDAAARAHEALCAQLDPDAVRRPLLECQERLRRTMRCYVSDLAAYERVAELTRMGLEKGGEWRGWTRGVRRALDACREPLLAANDGVAAGWREMGERGGPAVIAVHAGREPAVGGAA